MNGTAVDVDMAVVEHSDPQNNTHTPPKDIGFPVVDTPADVVGDANSQEDTVGAKMSTTMTPIELLE